MRELVLNEELDYGSFIFYDTFSNILQPKDKLRIRTTLVHDGTPKTKDEYYIVHEDIVNQASLAQNNSYFEHNVKFIETTNLLKGFTIPNKSFSRNIERMRLPVIPKYYSSIIGENVNNFIHVNITDFIFESYTRNQEYILPDVAVRFKGAYSNHSVSIKIIQPDSTVINLTNISHVNNRKIIFTQLGNHQIEYHANVTGYDIYTYFEDIFCDPEPEEILTIKDVINKLLKITIPLKVGEVPRFKLTTNEEVLRKLNVIAPEFFFFNMTL
jgi:hypothetical protein